MGSLGTGLFSGGAAYYSLLLFVVFALFANTKFGWPGAEGGLAGTAAVVACFFLLLMHLTSAMGTCKYRTRWWMEDDDTSKRSGFCGRRRS